MGGCVGAWVRGCVGSGDRSDGGGDGDADADDDDDDDDNDDDTDDEDDDVVPKGQMSTNICFDRPSKPRIWMTTGCLPGPNRLFTAASPANPCLAPIL